jgi:hypothetical protein
MASFVLGLGAMVALFVTGIPAIVLGVLALRDIQRSRGEMTGRGQAITGIVTGVLFGVFCTPIAGAAAFGIIQQIRNPPREYSDPGRIAQLIPKLPEHRMP